MSKDKILQVLGRHPFADTFTRDEETMLADISQEVEFEPGQYLLREDEPCWRFYLLITGLVSVELQLAGSEELRLETRGGGTVIGWSWLFAPNLGAFDVRALEKTRTIAVEAAAMTSLMDQHPDFACKALKELLRVVVQRLGQSRLQLVDIHSSGGERS